MVDTFALARQIDTASYLESDGEPMGETGLHALLIITSMGSLRSYFRHRPDVYVGANMFMYYTEGTPSDVVAPDLFVVFETHKAERRTWKIWEEGKSPDFIIEVTSEATRGQDRWFKRGLYEELRVQEYFLFDPLAKQLTLQLQGYRLVGGMYQMVVPKTTDEGQWQLESQVLNLYLRPEDTTLRFYEVETGTKLLTQAEAEDELAHLRAEYERLKKQLGA